ncbi:unnamed protein product [Cylindrotheca closterium]|uniref:C2H2-type domain-containing protein n=1 Tax=Cylindrotheca closterium TaxID=2856 RepID=A0AAD2FSS3_9STRA|nr:unnamed protein product [Cylindrotheca closterium]
MRQLHDDKKCPICKAPNETMVVDSHKEKLYDEYPIWGDELGAGFIYREDVGIHFESTYFESEIQPLFGYGCKVCSFSADEGPSAKKAPLKILQEHLRKDHRMALCNLCVENKRDFVTCLPRFTPSQLQNHLKTGDGPDSGFYGHPVCEFCKPKRFYDLANLHQHLHKEHYECHICKKIGLENQFFKNYKSLEKHFDQQHFLCHHPNCLAARFMVFENEIDLRAHEMQIHGASSTGSTKITVEFQTRRAGYDGSGVGAQQETPSESDFNYGLDGQAFVPDALPNRPSNGNNELHPQHVQRTEELRAQAATMREEQAARDQVESFPSLQAANAPAGSSAPLVGWASDTTAQRLQGGRRKNAGKVTVEDYPSLPTAANAKANAKKKAIRGNVGAARSTFAAMQTSVSAPSYGSAATRLRAPTSAPGFASSPRTSVNKQANLSADNFPSLGGATRPAPYAAANAYSKRNNQKVQTANYPALNSASDFPSMPGGAKTMSNRLQASASAFPAMPGSNHVGKKQTQRAAPSPSSMADFPSPPQSASSSKKKSVRDKMLGNAETPSSSHQAMVNVLQEPSQSAVVTIEDMKVSLGQKKFKQLKRMTREFAEGQLAPEGYVDQSASLFDKGYDDADFWSYLPSLIESCPNALVSQRALSYMTSLKHKEQSNLVQIGNAAPASSWGGGGTNNSIRKPPPQAKTTQRMVAPPAMRPATIPNAVPSKKNNAWGAAGKSTVTKTKATPGSVASAVASQGPQGGTATKFMAKQQKKKVPAQQQQQQEGQNGGKKKNKKKERDELRALAFGI